MVLNLPESLAVTSPPRQRVRVISSDVVTMVKCMSCLVPSPGHCEGSRGSGVLMYPWYSLGGCSRKGLLHNLVIYFDRPPLMQVALLWACPNIPSGGSKFCERRGARMSNSQNNGFWPECEILKSWTFGRKYSPSPYENEVFFQDFPKRSYFF